MKQLGTVIVGAGAAGYFCAIQLAEAGYNQPICILEATGQTLAKVKISGGGRCNVTHACYQPKQLLAFYPRKTKALEKNFKRFGPEHTIAWFQQAGVTLKTEADGRLFPTTDSSQTILDCLRERAKQLKIQVLTRQRVQQVQPTEQGFLLRTDQSDDHIRCEFLVLATGSHPSGYQLAQSLGHAIIPPTPSLFTFKVQDPELNALAGISVPETRLLLDVQRDETTERFEQTGPLLLTHWGVSGPGVLKLSAWGARALQASHYQGQLWIDWFPQTHHEALRTELLNLKQTPKLLKNWPIALPQRLWETLLTKSGLNGNQSAVNVKDKTLNQFCEKLKRWPITINGKGIFKEEFVTAGGIDLAELNLARYESVLCPRLMMIGELINVDGLTGGFNFQNAWTSGF